MNFVRRRHSLRRSGVAAVAGASGLLALAALVPGLGSTSVRAETTPTSVTYTTDGEHQFVVPAGVTSVHVVAIGKSGQPGSGNAPGAGGDGANVSADLAVTAGSSLYAEVNIGGGIGGAGTDTSNPPPAGGTGGGEFDVRTCSTTSCEPSVSSDPRILVAGGGGGGAPGLNAESAVRVASPAVSEGGSAGAGSAACDAGTGGTRGVDSNTSVQGHGGTCFQGGAGGNHPLSGSDGGPGDLIFGGQGGSTSSFGGGGGGAGFFGGGGGAADDDDGSALASGAGGGGSSCAPCAHVSRDAAAPIPLTNASITAAGGAAPSVTFSWTAPATPTPTATATASATTAPTGTVSAIVTTPSTGSGPTSGAWEPLLIGGLVLLGLGAVVGRRRGDETEAP